MSIKKITSKKKTQKKERKKKNTGQAYRVNQKIKKKKKKAGNPNKSKEKKEEEAGNVQDKQTKKKGESNVNEAYIVHGHFRPKMMLNFSFQFSLNFWKKTFWCVWGENT